MITASLMVPGFLTPPEPSLPADLNILQTFPGWLLGIGLIVLLCTLLILAIKIIGNANSDHPKPLTKNVIYMVIGGIILGAPLSILGAIGLAQ